MFGLLTKPGEGRFFPFLIAIVVLLVASPILGALDLERYYRLAFILVLLAGVRSLSNVKKDFYIALVLLVPALLTQVFAFAVDSLFAASLASASTVGVMIYVIFVLFRAVMSGEESTIDRIAGTTCIYLLLGILWTLFYSVLEYIQPGSLIDNGPAELRGPEDNQNLLIYFSFVTLTTLGYGDILPTTVAAQTLAWMEAVIGQLYLAIVLASMVGFYVAQQRVKIYDQHKSDISKSDDST
jgi:hypothetical protein